MSELSTAQAATMLRASSPTVRSLIATGQLVARREERGSRFVWWIDGGSVRRLLEQRGPYKGPRRSKEARLEQLEMELRRLQTDIAGRPSEAGGTEVASLRVRVVDLEEALVRSRSAAEMQRQADAERAQVIQLLMDALAAAERADALRRAAISELEEGLAVFSRPGNPSEIA